MENIIEHPLIRAEEALESFRIIMGCLPWWVGYEEEGKEVNKVLRFIKENLPPEHPDHIKVTQNNGDQQ